MPKPIRTEKIATPPVYKQVYDRFKGVDFSSDPSQIEDTRSPDALNLIADAGGFPRKRLGWRTLFTVEPPVNGIFFYDRATLVIHGGTKLYAWKRQGQPTLLKEGMHNAKSCSFLYQGKLYLLTGQEYLVYDGAKVQNVSEIAYVPTTTIDAPPAGGGTRLQDVNLLTAQRKNTFVADGAATLYQLDVKEITSVEEIKVNGAVVAASGYTVDQTKGQITFSAAPAKGAVAGTANVEVLFSKATAGNLERINRCTLGVIYSNRVFFAGNPDYPNADYASGVGGPHYVPDLSYTEIGYDGAAIMGYLRLGDSLAILKEDNAQDATIFLRTAQLTAEGMVFPVKQGISGAGAVSPQTCVNLVDDPLFLSREGVYAIATQLVSLERTLQVRSTRVNSRLLKEDLKNACAVSWDGFYLLAVGDHAYLADARQRSYTNNITGAYEYEWYYWDHFPARALLRDKEDLFFGTGDGRVCRLNTDRVNELGEPAMNAYSDDGAAIVAYWSTPVSDDGSFMTYKTMPKKGCGLYLRAYTRSSVGISVRTDRDFGRLIRRVNAGIFDFNELDFENFTFNTLPQNVIPFNTKVKKYKTIQIVVANDQADQGFGIYAIERKYVVGNAVK